MRACVCLFLTFCAFAQGGDLKIILNARAGQRSADSGHTALVVKRGETFSAQWTATNAAGPITGVTLHVFMDREGVTKPTANALYEGAVVLDFHAGEQSKGEFHMPLREPGNYVLRVETVGAQGHDVSASLMVTVQ